MAEVLGAREREAAAMLATAELQLSGIAQALADRNGATLRGLISLGQDGRVHAVLVPNTPLRMSKNIPDALLHIAVDPIMDSGMISVHQIEAVQRKTIEAEQDAGFPISERNGHINHKRHQPLTPTVDTRRQSIGRGITQPDELADYAMDTLRVGWRQSVQDAA